MNCVEALPSVGSVSPPTLSFNKWVAFTLLSNLWIKWICVADWAKWRARSQSGEPGEHLASRSYLIKGGCRPAWNRPGGVNGRADLRCMRQKSRPIWSDATVHVALIMLNNTNEHYSGKGIFWCFLKQLMITLLWFFFYLFFLQLLMRLLWRTESQLIWFQY